MMNWEKIITLEKKTSIEEITLSLYFRKEYEQFPYVVDITDKAFLIENETHCCYGTTENGAKNIIEKYLENGFNYKS
ncbi:MAG: hypothetical protein HUJ87_14970 [Fusobacterium varium]|uniref:hypothetical protein n=1 Tax=Fusobacterium varium TaxID=856 RepID=UPI00242EBC4E|nr:hypothetical protein [Fusobacterium varium]MCF0171794.1 hypothetical protein [Fusobacterium varium]